MIAVVGAGVVGLAAARALARRGEEVVVYEQFEVGHTRGSSHGRSRIFRLAYAEPEWVRLAAEALAGWRELEAETDERLLQLDGLLEIGEESAAALEACGVAFERLEPEAVERRFGVRVAEPTLLQPQAGIVHADRALRALAESAERHGAALVEGRRVRELDELDADVVVVAAGGWARGLLSRAGVDLPVRVTRETVAYFRLADRRPVPSVVSLRAGGGHDMYALADRVHGLKVGAHHAGAEADPDEEGAPDPAVVERIAEWTAARFELDGEGPVAAETCLYTTTADERFVLERRGRLVIASACSGHGFKFAPAVGARVAALAA